MADFFRRLVSGDKARYKDETLDIDLDLVYITDKIIVMGYPSSGLEALYRNRREDAKKFLEHRHGQNFWVFNFCPVKENSYPASVFDGRVSRYPFPDHHAPPLAFLPLVAREMRTWLQGNPEHVAVLHCKAGKGRSGTMACAYLLACDSLPSPSKPEQSATVIERVTTRAEQIMNEMPSDNMSGEEPSRESKTPGDPVKLEAIDAAAVPVDQEPPTSDVQVGMLPHPPTHRLSDVLELHTSRRMKRSSSPSNETKQGVSIPSQRRWLYYWSMVLAHQGPSDFWSTNPDVIRRPEPKIRLTRITLRMREMSGTKTNLVRVANAIIERTSYAKAQSSSSVSESKGQVWASLARYDDEFIATLERWERHTRDENGNMGKRRAGSERMEDEALADIFKDDNWDKGKMVRSFARLGVISKHDIHKEMGTDAKVVTRELRPLTDGTWGALRDSIQMNVENKLDATQDDTSSEEASIHDLRDVSKTLHSEDGVVLNANREVRIKLYMGQVFMGWFWFIPTFHMPSLRSLASQSITLSLKRNEIDFPIGIGSHILDVKVSLEWVPEAADITESPTRDGSPMSRQRQE
ncbi:phosphatases II [Laetiporus sulphureus 93-53]|uniref:phosphatidylinositol-3,4,5-trisphosphate 3-phosphatase n=1 Tax=Laetiporus sulphureus 93-53 TaxID=1314785 RepID=A0A165GGU6_9APHY|nr:phosphatases II [Laetiporus sulphureus 93-53]KZT10326.1 phosphatases II [Laetiporus sulphureus 93-53]